MQLVIECIRSLIVFETYIDKLDYLLGVNIIVVPPKVIKSLGGIKCGRLICTVNEKLNFQCGLVSLSKGNAYISINQARMKKLKLKTGDEIEVKLEKDESEFGMPVPEELSILFSQDEEGLNRFGKLSAAMKRYIIYYVGQVKNPQLRIERSVMLINNLKNIPEGKETFRAMLGKE